MPGNATLKLRRDTAANWTTANPVLALAEPGLETDTRKIKFGDGTTAWASLSYLTGVAAAAGYTVVAKAAAYTETTTSGDLLILASGTFTITLPSAVSNFATLTIKVTATGPITVAGASAQTIDGSASISLASGSAATLRSDNANWWVV